MLLVERNIMRNFLPGVEASASKRRYDRLSHRSRPA